MLGATDDITVGDMVSMHRCGAGKPSLESHHDIQGKTMDISRIMSFPMPGFTALLKQEGIFGAARP